MDGFIAFNLSSINKAFDCPMVVANAGSCRLILLASTSSPSMMVISPTPARAINSAAKDPTPPKPMTNTCACSNLSTADFPINNSVRESHLRSCILKHTFEVIK